MKQPKHFAFSIFLLFVVPLFFSIVLYGIIIASCLLGCGGDPTGIDASKSCSKKRAVNLDRDLEIKVVIYFRGYW